MFGKKGAQKLFHADELGEEILNGLQDLLICLYWSFFFYGHLKLKFKQLQPNSLQYFRRENHKWYTVYPVHSPKIIAEVTS